MPATPVTVPPPSATDAARLLQQATFGVTQNDVAHVQSVGISAYLDEQLAAAPSQYSAFGYMPQTAPATCQHDPATPTDASSLCNRDQYSLFQVQRQFFVHALQDSDQLRQRVAFALSEIFVVSGTEINQAYGMADYQNMLLKDAFANYRTLLQDVTLSPVMGTYLNMARNNKTNTQTGSAPNQNYGREVLQLCSLGLYKLNADGSQQLDAKGVAIPTYDQSVVEGFSAVFTGWTYPPLSGAASTWGNVLNYDGTMVAFAANHEPGEKLLLDGLTVPADQTPAQDLKAALDDIFNHPNVGPFIGRQLIQHLVTSNPSTAYVARISAVFANNGHGVRGDLGAVVKAILTDTEARGDQPPLASFGHLREPALFLSSVVRSLGGQSDGILLAAGTASMEQTIFTAPSVFNYYPPGYVVPGTDLLGPEFAIYDAASVLARANVVNTLIMGGGAKPQANVAGATGTTMDLGSVASITNPSAMVAKLNLILMHGSLSSQASAAILNALKVQAPGNPLAAARAAAYLILTSGQYQVER